MTDPTSENATSEQVAEAPMNPAVVDPDLRTELSLLREELVKQGGRTGRVSGPICSHRQADRTGRIARSMWSFLTREDQGWLSALAWHHPA